MKADKKKFAKELEQRTKFFAIRIIKLVSKLPNNPVGNVISYQLVKSGTSIGANYRESNRSVSINDFKNKIAICAKEASETQYWLEILMEAKILFTKDLHQDYQECTQLLCLFTTIKKNI